MDLITAFQRHITEQRLFAAHERLLLAVSGGVDSVVLCDLCKHSGFDFSIAHCNFQLRGAESDRDENFVRALGEQLGVETRVRRFETENYARENRQSIQEAARKLRYDWFDELAGDRSDEKRCQWILTAHQADDNAETILMNFLRGTGLHGLTGIPMKNGRLIRPLLPFSRESILAYAAKRGLAYVEDSSNWSNKYTRNYVRNVLVPAMKEVYPQVQENLQDNIRRFGEIERLYNLGVDALRKKLCRRKGVEIHIPIRQLLAFQNSALVYEIVSEYGFTEKQVDEVIKLAGSETGSWLQAARGPYRLIRHRHWLILSPLQDPHAEMIVVEEGARELKFGGGVLSFTRSAASGGKPSASPAIASLDAKKIQFPLLLRKWKEGDYFYPLGMKKKKKLSRFFIDQKLSRPEKENQWVIEMNKKIIWVVGRRIDERFKLDAASKEVFQINFISGQTG